MPRQYTMGGRAATPPAPMGGGRDAPPLAARSLRERFGALKNLPPFLKLVWQASPALTLSTLALRLVRALLPVVTLFVGKLIVGRAGAVCGVVRAAGGAVSLRGGA